MLLSVARDFVRQFARNARDSSVYEAEEIDRAILALLTRFCRRTRFRLTNTSLSLTASSSALPSLPTGFHPSKVQRAYLSSSPSAAEPLQICSHSEILQYIYDYGTSEGTPTMLAFTSDTTGLVHPTPSENMTLVLVWSPACTWFTPGGSGSVSLDLPDDILTEILTTGAGPLLQYGEVEAIPLTNRGWQAYLQLEADMRGTGARGAKAQFKRLPY